MTTEKKSEPATTTTVNDNKAVFGPLGKYAVVAVIMVSIIVTTAIMLNQQLMTVEDQIAAIENEVAESHAIAAEASDIAVSETEVVASAVETKEVTPVETAAITDVKAAPVSNQATEVESAEVLVAIEAKPATANETSHVADVENVKTVETATSVQTPETPAAMENQDRIEAYKLEQKQRMAEMFARIRTLESQQLEQYKSSQDEQLARLRDQVNVQQQMIDSLALRNKELFEIRAANVKRNQTNREQVLNRI